MPPPSFAKPVWALIGAYFIASLAHFAHNAEFIAFYPNMPAWLTREKVYIAWLAITGVGAAGLVARRAGLPAFGLFLLAVYGAFGLDGLGHYALALCSQHTFATNLTIWSEAVSGLALMLVSVLLGYRRLRIEMPTRPA